jgi:hypothetical protein
MDQARSSLLAAMHTTDGAGSLSLLPAVRPEEFAIDSLTG